LCECQACTFRFFDSRLTDSEVSKLYAGYRGNAYFKARHAHEPWYSRSVNDGIGSDLDEIATRKENLTNFLGARARSISTVLDYGGDRGQFIPEHLGEERYVFEISDAPTAPHVARLQSVADRQFDFVMLAHVLEHCSQPAEMLDVLRPLLHEHSLLYLEVPLERPSLAFAGSSLIQRRYLDMLVKLNPLLKLVDLYSTVARVKFNMVPPLGLQKCSEHLNFFTRKSLLTLLEGNGFELLDSGTATVASNGPIGEVLFTLARLRP
jgi:hypothetical protein